MKKYRVGVIGRTGRGNYGHGLDRVWLDIEQAEIVGVADDDRAGLAAAVKRLGGPQGFADYREMLDKTKPQIVSIAQRWLDKHHEMVLECASRGIHIYLEKPMCRSLQEADEMVTACERSHVKLAIAHQSRYGPKIPVIKEIIESGKLGRVLEFRARGKEDHRGGGEDLWVLGTHLMDLIQLFGGEPTWCMAEVTQGGQPITAKDVQPGNEGIGPLAGDGVRAMYGMKDGATTYFSSYRQMAGKPSRFALQIFGSRGVLETRTGYLPTVKFLDDPGWSPGVSGKTWQNVSSEGLGEEESLSGSGQHPGNVLAVKDLIAAIEADREPNANVYTARAATEMIVAVFESHRQGAKVELPLKNRKNPLSML